MNFNNCYQVFQKVWKKHFVLNIVIYSYHPKKKIDSCLKKKNIKCSCKYCDLGLFVRPRSCIAFACFYWAIQFIAKSACNYFHDTTIITLNVSINYCIFSDFVILNVYFLILQFFRGYYNDCITY